jgi:hypothetical protein
MLVVAMLPPLSPVSMLATPSIVMLFEFGRWPFTVNPLTCAISAPPALCDTTPGTSVAKLNIARPLLAMFVSASFSSVNERSPLVVCSSLMRAVTLMLSCSEPTSSMSVPADNRSFAFTTRFVCSSVLNPSRVARRMYESGRTIGKTNRP